MINYKHNEVKKGDLIRSTDWNTMGFSVDTLYNEDVMLLGEKAISGRLLVSENEPVAMNELRKTLSVTGDAGFTGDVIVGENGDSSLHTRHVAGKNSTDNEPDNLYLQYYTGKKVIVNRPELTGGVEMYGDLNVKGDASFSGNVIVGNNGDLKVTGDASFSGSVIVGNNGDANLHTRHLSGKSGVNNDPDSLYLQYYTGKKVIINRPGQHGGLDVYGDTFIKGDLRVEGKLIRKVHIATGLGPEDDRDSGLIKGRVLTFNKKHSDTAIRITYCDNFRVYGHNSAARLRLLVNGEDPKGGALIFDKYCSTSDAEHTNQHEPETVMGYAIGVSSGNCEITINIEAITNHRLSNTHIGWHASRWTIEAEEVFI